METKKQIYTYTVVFEPAEEGGYVAYVPALPGCHTQGETFEETRAMIQDAIIGHLAVLTKDGEAVPEEAPDRIEAKITIPVTA